MIIHVTNDIVVSIEPNFSFYLWQGKVLALDNFYDLTCFIRAANALQTLVRVVFLV